jgi:hypothetical protein
MSYGQGLVEQGLAGDAGAQASREASLARAVPAEAPTAPAPTPAAQQQPAEPPREIVFAAADFQAAAGAAAASGGGAWSDKEEQELRTLSEELLGNIATLEGLTVEEKQEMLQILRENQDLRKRLQN